MMNRKNLLGMLMAIVTACMLTVGCSDSDDKSGSGGSGVGRSDSGTGGTNAGGGAGGSEAGGAGGGEAGGTGGSEAGGSSGSEAGGAGGSDMEDPDTKCTAWCAKVMVLNPCKPAADNDECMATCKGNLVEGKSCRNAWDEMISCETVTELKCDDNHPMSSDETCAQKRRTYVMCSTSLPTD